jgi:AraC-like DNA-binding protein
VALIGGFPKNPLWLNPQYYRSHIIRRILKAIHYHPEKSLKEHADNFGLSVGRIYHLFTENGKEIRVGKWIKDERMSFAAQCILLGYPPTQVYKAFNYSTLQSFCRAFSSYWGRPCRKYKMWALVGKEKYPLISPHKKPAERPPGIDYYKIEV